MKTKQINLYECEICKTSYKTQEAALLCESRPVSEDKGVKVGDVVLITEGEGAGRKARVTEVSIIDKDWGHYSWEKYWHTIMITADIIDGWGSRILTFDSYVLFR